MEQICRTCIHRKNYECTCEELKESVYQEFDFHILENLSRKIDSIILEKVGDILDKYSPLEDDIIQEILGLLDGECLGDEIVDTINEAQDGSKIMINLDNDFVCKHWR